jgi:enamidase
VDRYPWPARPVSGLEIDNARIVDFENNRILDGQSVQIENGRIVRIGAAPSAGAAARLDARGAYLVPGLIDVHVHLQDPVRSVLGGFDFTYFVNSLLGAYAPQRREYLESGVTTVRSLGEPAAQIFEMRARIAAHDLLGPRIFAVGRLVTSPHGHPVSTIWTPQISRQSAILAAALPEMTRGLEKNYSEGPPDAVKVVYGTIGRAKEKLSRDLLNQAVAWSKQRGLISIVHAETTAEVADAVESGASGVEHLASVEDLPDSLIAALRSRRTFVDPTFGEFVTARMLAGDNKEEIDRQLRRKYELVRRLHSAGVPLVVGTDAPLVPYGQGLLDELDHFAKAGFTPAQILTFVTQNNAAYLGRPGELGKVAPGFRADLVLVRDNPLANIGNLRKPEWVIRDGQIVAGARAGAK